MSVRMDTVVNATNYATLSEFASRVLAWAADSEDAALWEDDAAVKAAHSLKAEKLVEAAQSIQQAADCLKRSETISYDLMYGRMDDYR